MGRALHEAKLTTVNARKLLEPGLFWRGLDTEVHLGYRKGKRGGVWLVRWRHGSGYRRAPIGTADDIRKEDTLSYEQAKTAAIAYVEDQRGATAAAALTGEAITVRQAIEQYVGLRDERDTKRAGRSVRSDASQRLGRYILGTGKRGERIEAAVLCDVQLYSLKKHHLAAWLRGLPRDLSHATLERLVNDARAALNRAYADGGGTLPAGLPEIIAKGLSLPEADEAEEQAREDQVLTDQQLREVLKAAKIVDERNGWDGDLHRLLAVLAATGARLSQVARIRVRDFQPDKTRLFVPVARKGRGHMGKLTHTPVALGADVVSILEPVVKGRPAAALLLERWRHVQKPGGIEWKRAGRGPWQASSELSRDWKEIRTMVGLPAIVPYSLRHTSIVRGIRAGLPLKHVADLHNTSVAMIERHYGRWLASDLEDLAARAVIPLL
ncbi:MAG: integrase family protein [Devosia sp.]|uniref:tyrosine-type recombinase/integrase n=1 Tax=Devosia sp. TaxID=1871048 RepID=UPI0026296518|nr:tyrosine-type recombinase/integrase [Devosia sp.]MDB5541385.1 integrase family protein [Devosia sp.]